VINQPLVTIGITTYNSNLIYLSEALESVINQNYKNIEVIVCDDFSKNIDQIKNLIDSKNDQRISFISKRENKGVSDSLNKIIEKSKGKFFCWCPDDDYMHKSRVKNQLVSLKNDSESISLCNHYQVIDYFKIKRKIGHQLYLFFINHYLYSIFFDRINSGSLMIPIEILKKYKFDLKLKHIQDYDVLHKIFKKNSIVHLNEYLFFSRTHSKQESEKNYKIASKEISEFYLNFFKENLFYILYFFGKKNFFLIYTFFIFRGIDQAANYLINENHIKTIVKNFFRIGFSFSILLNICKILGLTLKVFKILKNILFYKVLYKFRKTS
jgi:glycosyltransferase involved in cell wall biosynthesis